MSDDDVLKRIEDQRAEPPDNVWTCCECEQPQAGDSENYCCSLCDDCVCDECWEDHYDFCSSREDDDDAEEEAE